MRLALQESISSLHLEIKAALRALHVQEASFGSAAVGLPLGRVKAAYHAGLASTTLDVGLEVRGLVGGAQAVLTSLQLERALAPRVRHALEVSFELGAVGVLLVRVRAAVLVGPGNTTLVAVLGV